MVVKGKLRVLTIILVAGTASAGSAQDQDVGQVNFRISCASCHGAEGKGNGPVSGQLKVPPPDLTVLAKKNNGVFPVSRVYEIIDGRQQVMAHGTRDMPIWGFQYSLEQRVQGHPATAIDPDAIVRMRILSIIDYLSRIQQQ
jgi:mono/diheme cytochrome c family protein